MKIPIFDIESKIVNDIDYKVELKFGVLKFRFKLQERQMFRLISALIQGRDFSISTQIECLPLPQDRRKKYFEITDETFNPRMIDESKI
ncbi:MAG: hypothetical protein GTO02_00005 [Candidatus Dadabacteria bacterium]|nr:hypothetical protein [Candidatus Dadabacteria bacterium]NIQ12833.1 hypothetical protein [Candidatus Dadabacteria bacterium]